MTRNKIAEIVRPHEVLFADELSMVGTYLDLVEEILTAWPVVGVTEVILASLIASALWKTARVGRDAALLTEHAKSRGWVSGRLNERAILDDQRNMLAAYTELVGEAKCLYAMLHRGAPDEGKLIRLADVINE